MLVCEQTSCLLFAATNLCRWTLFDVGRREETFQVFFGFLDDLTN